MRGKDFIKDKMMLLVLQICCMCCLVLFLRLTGYSRDDSVIILLCWGIILIIWLMIQFLQRRNYYNKMQKIVENLDQRYLLGELMPVSFRLDDKLYREMIRRSNKAVIERIHQMEEERKEYQEYIESWVHEIKTPITGIALNCENHKDERSRYIAEENRKIENYVDMALYYARSEEVYKDYMISETDLQTIAEDVIMKNKQYLIQCRIQVEIQCKDLVYADKKWITFILNQLVLNSAKYRPSANAHILICTERKKEGIVLKVKDNGIGIKKEELPRIFEKGFTGTNGRQTERSTGMGLYLCRKLCDKLGIAITATSAEGEGTEVALVFAMNSFFSDYRQ